MRSTESRFNTETKCNRLPKGGSFYRRYSTLQEPTTEGNIDPGVRGTGRTLEKEIHLAPITEARRTQIISIIFIPCQDPGGYVRGYITKKAPTRSLVSACNVWLPSAD